MYKDYFGFIKEPFGITPDPRFFYESPIYLEAFTTLARGVSARRGVMTLVGAVGTGKTTVLRHLMANSEPGVRCILVDYPPASLDELLTLTCGELGVSVSEPRGRLAWITALKDAVLRSHADNGTTALLLDEAQHLTEETLEGVRLLSNLETAGDKVLQIVLAGQPELCTKLDQPSLAALKQRITFECRLDRLRPTEVATYIDYRLSVAGYRGPALFVPDAAAAISFYSGGVPRLINILCSNTLAAAHRASERRVSLSLVVEAARALRIGPAFDYSPPPAASGVSAAEQLSRAPDPNWRDSPSVPDRGELHTARARQRQAGQPSRWPVKRRRLWTLLGCLACVLAGTAGVALWRMHDSQVASYDGQTPALPAATRAAGGQAELVGSPGPTDVRPPEGAPTSTRAAASEDVTPATVGPARPPAAGAPAGPTGARETPMAAAEKLTAARAVSPMTTTGSKEDTVEHGPAPAPARPPTQQVVLQRGATISGIAWSTFGPQMYLALDLLKDLNPHIDNLNRVLAGQRLRLPRLGHDDLVRAERDGSYRLILDSFPNPADAQALTAAARARGYDAVVMPRHISDDLTLFRVEITGLPDKAAARRASDTALEAARPARETPMVEGARRPRP